MVGAGGWRGCVSRGWCGSERCVARHDKEVLLVRDGGALISDPGYGVGRARGGAARYGEAAVALARAQRRKCSAGAHGFSGAQKRGVISGGIYAHDAAAVPHADSLQCGTANDGRTRDGEGGYVTRPGVADARPAPRTCVRGAKWGSGILQLRFDRRTLPSCLRVGYFVCAVSLHVAPVTTGLSSPITPVHVPDEGTVNRASPIPCIAPKALVVSGTRRREISRDSETVTFSVRCRGVPTGNAPASSPGLTPATG
jgi:hypothetical protein